MNLTRTLDLAGVKTGCKEVINEGKKKILIKDYKVKKKLDQIITLIETGIHRIAAEDNNGVPMSGVNIKINWETGIINVNISDVDFEDNPDGPTLKGLDMNDILDQLYERFEDAIDE